MRTPQFSNSDLNKLRQQLNAWRRTRRGQRRIPDEVWTAATALARVHGAGQVGRSLQLDYYKLRQRLQPGRDENPGPSFVEVGWPKSPALPALSGSCTVELLDGNARRMRLQLAGETPTLVALAEAFWRGTR